MQICINRGPVRKQEEQGWLKIAVRIRNAGVAKTGAVGPGPKEESGKQEKVAALSQPFVLPLDPRRNYAEIVH